MAFKNHRAYWACPCGFANSFRDDLLCFEYGTARNVEGGVALASSGFGSSGDGTKLVGAAPGNAQRGELAQRKRRSSVGRDELATAASAR